MLEKPKPLEISPGEMHTGGGAGGSKAGRVEPLKAFDIRQSSRIQSCPVGCWSCVGTAFPCYYPITSFWNGNVCSMLSYVESAYFFFIL